MRPIFLFLIAVTLSGMCCGEAIELTSDELVASATDVVSGRVRAVYSSTDQNASWKTTKSVAVIVVEAVAKGDSVSKGDVVHAHFWGREWIGKGDPEPSSNGHASVAVGDHVTAHLTRKDGVYEPLLPNGFVITDQPTGSTNASRQDASRRELDRDFEQVQGRWKRTVETANGTFELRKEHTGNTTTLTITDADGNVVEEKASEFRLERRGGVRVFTFFNNTFLAGPRRGQASKDASSYIYRVDRNRFIEVRGMLFDQKEPPAIIVWEQIAE